MASENRTSTHPLIAELEEAAYRFDFFEALRLIESLNPDKPRLGTGIKARDDAVRLSQEPEMQFAPSALSSYSVGNKGVPRLAVNFFGLFGPNGALPLHLTEYARERLRHHHDPTFARFADIFHHRMISLFYRAWANVRPTVTYDRPESDRFEFYVGSLMGISGEAYHNRDTLSDRAKLFYSGHYASQTKNPEGLLAIIADILSIKVQLEEFVGEWMEIQQKDYSRLGYTPDIATLGQSVLLGAYVWGCQHKFRLVLGPLRLEQYLSLLPGAVALAQLVSIVRNYLGDELVWDAKMILKREEVPAELVLGTSLLPRASSLNGNARLGWSMWLGPRPDRHDADDLTLNPFFKSNAT
ncbi:MAG: type VI secretion system baseplate subunit TssG [Methylococcaceae bacterium]|nr:type VI secretion system baseplate subunit TssG [Methylococcaceae bacterium]